MADVTCLHIQGLTCCLVSSGRSLLLLCPSPLLNVPLPDFPPGGQGRASAALVELGTSGSGSAGQVWAAQTRFHSWALQLASVTWCRGRGASVPQSPYCNVDTRIIISPNIFKIRKCETGPETASAPNKWKL